MRGARKKGGISKPRVVAVVVAWRGRRACGLSFIAYSFVPPPGTAIVGSPETNGRSLSTLNVTAFPDALCTLNVCSTESRALHLMTSWPSASGSSAVPCSSYSKLSPLLELRSVSLHFSSQPHVGVNVMG